MNRSTRETSSISSDRLWAFQAENFDEEIAENKDVVAFQRIRVAIYNNSKRDERVLVRSLRSSRIQSIGTQEYADQSQS